MRYNETGPCNHYCIVLAIDEQLAGIGRDRLIHILHAEKVLARRYLCRVAIGWSRIAHISPMPD